MVLDPLTLLFSVVLVVTLTTGAYLVTWLQDRRETAMLWMAASALLGSAGLIARVALPPLLAIAIGNCAILIALGLIWTACRRLRGHPPRLVLIILPPAIWLGLCGLPEFTADLNLRIVATCTLALGPIGLAIAEMWHLPRDEAVARWWVMAVLALQAVEMFGQAVASLIWPHHAQQEHFESATDFKLVMIDALSFILLLAFGMIALVKERLKRRYRDAARLDAITGLGNRWYFEQSLRRHFRRARASGRPLALIMIDVDEFKAYNDLYGHPAGDRCLRALADALASTCRSTDIAARYGGEEFAVLLPDTDCRAAASVAERMRLRVRELGLRHDGRPDGVVTISLGVAAVIPRSGETSPGRLVDAADRSLYIAKQAGRDRTHCSDDGENPSAAMPPPAPPECQQTASAPAK